MSNWWWVLIFGGITVVALGLYALLGLRLWRKAKVLISELGRLSAATATLSDSLESAGDHGRPARADADRSYDGADGVSLGRRGRG